MIDLELLQKRAHIIREITAFFDSRQDLSLDTPLLSPDLIPESCLEVFETSWLPPPGSRQKPEKYWLIPSPEIWMKPLIARYGISMYQICKCFRNTESRGHLHCPEFTMLEYYTVHADYMDSLALTEELFADLTAVFPCKINSPSFIKITMEEAFRTWAGFSLAEISSAGKTSMEKEARRLGLEADLEGLADSEAIHLLYDLIFIHAVEPSLPKETPVALIDYPAFVPCLAKNGKNTGKDYQTKERWELYINGIELANCYSEETDPLKIRLFFEEEAKKKQHSLVKHRINHDFWKYFLPNRPGAEQTSSERTSSERTSSERTSPLPFSGVALGLDRLIMILCEKSTINSILPFQFF